MTSMKGGALLSLTAQSSAADVFLGPPGFCRSVTGPVSTSLSFSLLTVTLWHPNILDARQVVALDSSIQAPYMLISLIMCEARHTDGEDPDNARCTTGCELRLEDDCCSSAMPYFVTKLEKRNRAHMCKAGPSRLSFTIPTF